jgi:hypothetical protein
VDEISMVNLTATSEKTANNDYIGHHQKSSSRSNIKSRLFLNLLDHTFLSPGKSRDRTTGLGIETDIRREH